MADSRVPGIVSVLALLVGVALAAMWVFQRRLIYFPVLEDVPPVRSSLPGAEDVTFETADGVRLGGWFLASGAAGGPAVLVCQRCGAVLRADTRRHGRRTVSRVRCAARERRRAGRPRLAARMGGSDQPLGHLGDR